MSRLSLDEEVADLVHRFKTVLDAHDSHLRSFCAHGVQLEGWLKGEFLNFLDEESTTGKIVGFDREVKLAVGQRKKVDLAIQVIADGEVETIWVELKHWLIGRQRGVMYPASFYFSDPSSVGISADVKKLAKVANGGGYLLILATAHPGDDEWQNGVAIFNQKFAPLSLKSLAQATHYPASYYLGILKVV